MNKRIVAIMGSGVIGSSWAANFAMRGCTVSVYDIAPNQLERAKTLINEYLAAFIEYGVMERKQADELCNGIVYTCDASKALHEAQFIQEAGPDNVEIKRAILATIDTYTPKSAVVASSTSGLSIADIVEGSRFPGRVVGAHPFNPPHLIPLVEIMTCSLTELETVEKIVEFYESMKKVPVVMKKERKGFIANRLTFALYREAIDMVLNGYCTIEDVDKAMLYGPGLRYAVLGPNMLYELGAESGISGMRKLAPSVNKVYEDLATWGARPDYWYDIAQDGVNEEMGRLPSYMGNTREEVKKYRDRMLLKLLELHELL